MSVFEHLARDDAREQERVAGNRAVIAAQARVQENFLTFVSNAAGPEDRDARLSLLDDEIKAVVAAVCEEYGYDGDTELVHQAALEALGAGHPAGCDCGFCKNKGKLFESDDDEEEDSEKKESKTAADYPGKDYSVEGGEYVKDWNPEEDQTPAQSEDESDKEAWHKAKIASQTVSMFHEADGFSFCECPCEGCKTANHCESDKCISTKHSGNPGTESGEKTSAQHLAMAVSKKDFVAISDILRKNGADPQIAQQIADYFATQNPLFDEQRFMDAAGAGGQQLPPQVAGLLAEASRLAADVETGDTFVTERLDLGTDSGKNGVQDVGSPKIDKSQVPGGGGIPGEGGLDAIDVPSNQHPSETQDMHETPDYWEPPIGPSETGKSIDAQEPLAPETYAADNTDTWTGTEGQANPVTSKLSKWQILT